MSEPTPEVWTEREGGQRIELERDEDGNLWWPQGVTSGWIDPGTLPRVEHDPRCYQSVGVPADLPQDLCDCRVFQLIDRRTAKP
jgi:hypothetical protein